MAKSYRQIMKEHKTRYATQILNKWENSEEKKRLDWIFKRLIAMFILADIFLALWQLGR